MYYRPSLPQLDINLALCVCIILQSVCALLPIDCLASTQVIRSIAPQFGSPEGGYFVDLAPSDRYVDDNGFRNPSQGKPASSKDLQVVIDRHGDGDPKQSPKRGSCPAPPPLRRSQDSRCHVSKKPRHHPQREPRRGVIFFVS